MRTFRILAVIAAITGVGFAMGACGEHHHAQASTISLTK